MSKYYLEIIEEETVDNAHRPLEMLRVYVADEKEAEDVFATEYSKLKEGTPKATMVEMNHNADQKLNKPCKEKQMVDGKLEKDWK